MIDPRLNESSESAGMRTFLRIAQRWNLTKEEGLALLAESDPSRWEAWRTGDVEGLSPEQIQRLSLTFGIYKAINILIPLPERADAWVRRSNTAPAFAGRSALDLMTSKSVRDIEAVRRYLDAQLS